MIREWIERIRFRNRYGMSRERLHEYTKRRILDSMLLDGASPIVYAYACPCVDESVRWAIEVIEGER